MRELPAGILPPVVTPFADERFDTARFASFLRHLNATGLSGYVVLGSNGEAAHLDDAESISVVEAAAAARSRDKALIVGAGRASTAAAIEFARRSARAGADALLVAPPGYYRDAMTEAALEAHYSAIADASEVPLVLYNIPKFTGVHFTPRLVKNLARHPNVRGIKDSSSDLVFLAQVLAERPADFRVYVGSASVLLAGISLGADGGVPALGNIAPEACVRLWSLATSGDLASARRLQSELLQVNQAVTARFGVAGLKRALRLLGHEVGEPRRPLVPLGDAETRDLEAVLETAGLLRRSGAA